jgi:peptide/nickel transport system permease protein
VTDTLQVAVSTPLPVAIATRPVGLRRAWRSWRNPIGLVGAVVILITVLVAVAAPLVAPFEPSSQAHKRLLPPGAPYVMGTDELGRDTFSRIVFGARVSLQVGALAVTIALVLGTTLGLLGGFYGGRLDDVLMRVVDIMFAFPGIVLAIVIAGLLGPSRNNAMLAIGIVYAPAFARVVRGSVMAVMAEPYMESARVTGASDWRAIRLHVLPNVLAPLIVMVSVYLSQAILSEAALSFLGLGTQPPEPSWGGMLSASRPYMELAPWMAICPGAAIMLVVLGFNFLGDGLRDVLYPRLQSL